MAVEQVTQGAQLQCSFGMAPSMMTVTSNFRVTCQQQMAATIQDHVPMTNIQSFGMCTTLSNPAVAAATAAKLSYSPAPCIPATTTPWTPPAVKTTIGSLPALLKTAQCTCMWGGMITVTNSGQMPPKVEDT